MTWFLVLVSLTLFVFSDAALTKRSSRNQNFQHYEVQTFASSNPVSHLSNIIDAIAAPLNILSDRLTRQPGDQQFNPGFSPPPHNRGPPGHFSPPGHRGPHDHRHNHGPPGQQQKNPFHYPPQPLPPYLANLPSREQFNRPGTQVPQGQFPRDPNQNFFPFGQNYPKPGFSNHPGNANANSNENNRGNTGCIGFCLPPQSQPQRPNPFGSNGNSFGVSNNNAQNNNGFGTQDMPSQGNGLVVSTFSGFGTDGRPIPQSQPGNQFENGGFNNNNFGGPSNTPQNNNGFGTQDMPSQGNGLVVSTFSGFGTDGRPIPQSQPGNQFENGGFNNNNFGGPSNTPQNNNGFGTQDMPSQGNGLVVSTFSGFGTDGRPIPQSQPGNQFGNGGFNNNNFGGPSNTPQNNNGFGTQDMPSQGNGLVVSTFSGFGTDGRPIPQSQPGNQFGSGSLNNNGGPSNTPQNNNGLGTQDMSSSGNGLVVSTFSGFGTDGRPIPQSQPGNQFGSDSLNNNNNGGPSNTPQNNNGLGTQDMSSSGNGLIISTFAGFGTDGRPIPQSQPGNQFGSSGLNNNNIGGPPSDGNQPTKPSDNDGLISSIFGDQPSSGSNGIPNSQSQTNSPSNSNDSSGLISSIFAGFPTNNNDKTAPTLPPSGGNGNNNLIEGVFGGFGTSAPPVNAGNGLQPTTEMSAEMKANNDLIESIFSGINNDKSNGQNVPQPDFGTSTVPPSTTNSDGLIYDIDVRSS